MTVYQLATCTASILRGTSTNAYGDEVDATIAVATGLLASIREVASRVYDPTTETHRVVRDVRAQVQSDVDIRIDDRLRDDTHGVTYSIQNVTRLDAPGFTPDVELELKRVT